MKTSHSRSVTPPTVGTAGCSSVSPSFASRRSPQPLTAPATTQVLQSDESAAAAERHRLRESSPSAAPIHLPIVWPLDQHHPLPTKLPKKRDCPRNNLQTAALQLQPSDADQIGPTVDVPQVAVHLTDPFDASSDPITSTRSHPPTTCLPPIMLFPPSGIHHEANGTSHLLPAVEQQQISSDRLAMLRAWQERGTKSMTWQDEHGVIHEPLLQVAEQVSSNGYVLYGHVNSMPSYTSSTAIHRGPLWKQKALHRRRVSRYRKHSNSASSIEAEESSSSSASSSEVFYPTSSAALQRIALASLMNPADTPTSRPKRPRQKKHAAMAQGTGTKQHEEISEQHDDSMSSSSKPSRLPTPAPPSVMVTPAQSPTRPTKSALSSRDEAVAERLPRGLCIYGRPLSASSDRGSSPLS